MDKLELLKAFVKAYIEKNEDEVAEAYDNREGMQSGEYDFGHAQDSYDRGFDDGRTVGGSDFAEDVINFIDSL